MQKSGNVQFEINRGRKRKRPVTKTPSIFANTPNDNVEKLNGKKKNVMLLLEDTPTAIGRYKDQGNILAESGKYRAAIGLWNKGLELDDKNAILYELKAQAFMQLYDFFNSIKMATKAVELSPNWSDAYLTLARAQFNFGEIGHSRTNFQKAFDLCSDNQDICDEIKEVDMLLETINANQKAVQAEIDASSNNDDIQVKSCKKNLALRLN